MVNTTDRPRNLDEISTELQNRFDPDEATLAAVLDKMEEAQQVEELSSLPHWENPEQLGDHIEKFSRGYGLQAGWNTWVGIQKVDTSHLTIDVNE